MDLVRPHTHSLLTGAWTVAAALALLAAQPPRAAGLTKAQEEILSHLSIRYAPDGQGGQNKTLVIAGVNVQVINGLGGTATANGLGNLIVGYNELGGQDRHLGSHNLVSGHDHHYTSYGGLVVGLDNAITGAYSSVGGGRFNLASGEAASISGGSLGIASGTTAAIAGGRANDATGEAASVAGGLACRATGDFSSVAGGFFNHASASHSNVSGGDSNKAGGEMSTVSGGCGLTTAIACEHLP